MSKRVVVPVDMGGSPTRCALSPPRGPLPTPELIEALICHYIEDRLPPAAGQIEVGFFHGGVPGLALLAAAYPHPIRLACSPADLDLTELDTLHGAGTETIELDVGTFHDKVLWGCRRGYNAAEAVAKLRALREHGFRVGATLIPGLPRSQPDHARRDVAILTGAAFDEPPLVNFIRIYPALAFEKTDLAQWFRTERWEPPSQQATVDQVETMVDDLEAAGVEVARIGLQPGQDLPHKLVAGPHHPNLRGMVETQRFRKRMARALNGVPQGTEAALMVHPKDLAWAKGTANENVRHLRKRLGLPVIAIKTDDTIPRGEVRRS